MVKLVLMHKPGSIYEDEPDRVYDFPKRYLSTMQAAVGDWVIYYEPVKAGPLGYFAVARLEQVIEKPGMAGRYLGVIAQGSYLDFDRTVPRLWEGRALEQALTAPDGTLLRGGLVQSAVRRLPDRDFAAIVGLGLPADIEEREARRYDPPAAEGASADGAVGLAEEPLIFERPIVERLVRRPYRDVVFRRKVRQAYDYRCAMSGLKLRNGGGRPEVQAAHIRPVEENGTDSVRNGLALSGTLHWMFDRGLISVAEDQETILISHNKVPEEVVNRLIHPSRKLLPPVDAQAAPHPENLRWHRENRFGQGLGLEGTPWG